MTETSGQSDFSLQLLGDQAILAGFPNETGALQFARWVRAQQLGWVYDVVLAYQSVAVFYSLDHITPDAARRQLTEYQPHSSTESADPEGTLHRIPCCYEMGLDWEPITQRTDLSRDAIIRLHAETAYTVYAIGFCPGFPFMGYLPSELQGVPRLDSPRVRLDAGSVGLTGKQTGIYTLPRPGGWNIVGRTPLQLVDVHDAYFPLDVGDRVQFERIDEKRFRELEGERL